MGVRDHSKHNDQVSQYGNQEHGEKQAVDEGLHFWTV
jgi:hypothetical protein